MAIALFAGISVKASEKIVRIGYQKAGGFLRDHTDVARLFLKVLKKIGERARTDPTSTAAFLAARLGISSAVMDKSELRKQRCGARPLTTEWSISSNMSRIPFSG